MTASEMYYEEERKARKKRSEARKAAENKAKLWAHRIWRIINWALITCLACAAFSRILSLLHVSRTGRLNFIFFVFMVGLSGVMVRFAEGTSHDLFRRKSGQIITIVSEAIILLPVLFDTIKIIFMDLVNGVTEEIGGTVFRVEEYRNSDLGAFWWLSLIIAAGLCISLLWEEQSTDKKLAFARTSQKRDVTDIGETKDDDGNPIYRIVKYKK